MTLGIQTLRTRLGEWTDGRLSAPADRGGGVFVFAQSGYAAFQYQRAGLAAKAFAGKNGVGIESG